MRNYSVRKDRDRGLNDGFTSGWTDGWRLGACKGIDEVIQQNHSLRPAPCKARILYVPQGFEAIDQGVISALQVEAAEVRVAAAEEMHVQAADFRPDAVLVMNGLHIFPPDHLEQVDAIRNLGIPTSIWFVDDPYVTDLTVRVAPRYDYVFTHERTCIPLYQSLGCAEVHHLPLAAHFDIFKPMAVPQQYRTDICFIGVAFWNRVAIFDQIAPYLADKRVLIGGGLWERMNRYSTISKFVHDGWIDVRETAKYYNGAKIVINLHRSAEAGTDNLNGMNWPAESVNPRTFELSSCATLQLTDLRSELSEHYTVGSEIAVFENAEQLVQQLEYYLTHDEERLRIAVQGYKRTIKDHTFRDRIRKLLNVMELQI